MKSDVDSPVQVEVFEAQLALALKHQIPLVIHCRSGPRGPGDAEKICLSVMKHIVGFLICLCVFDLKRWD
ncbi:unnamed protein product [Strongylus vulgaris]|uniref:Uncharacterized protein n=1 Tax=Strongylus vulgaris TaxID=40348 RepID=A0A3P7IJ89_STRVU|nr:unnamed protein product [Strongylus vulgaris]